MNNPKRYSRHGKLVAWYGVLSFAGLWVITFIVETWIYWRLEPVCHLPSAPSELKCDGEQIWITTVHMSFQRPSAGRLGLFLLAASVGLLIGYLIKRLWRGWIFIPLTIYALVPLVVWPDPVGIHLVAFSYAALIYIMRFALKFNPHLQLLQRPKDSQVALTIFQIYHQYALLSLAVIGLTLTTFLFSFESAFKDFWEPAWTHLPGIREPFYVAHAAFLFIGIAGLAVFVCREFHVKQEEVLTTGLMPPIDGHGHGEEVTTVDVDAPEKAQT